MRKALCTTMLITMLGAVGAAPTVAQVPVIDTTAVAQLIQQVSQSLQQLQAAQAELQQVQTLVTGVTGARGMDQIAGALFQPNVRTAIPDTTANLLGTVGSAISTFGALSSAAQTIRSNGQITTYPGNSWFATELARVGDRRAVEMAAAQQIYNTAVTRRANLDLLRQQLANTTDQATALQLGARVQTEMAHGINDLQASNALLIQQTANAATDAQRQQETGATQLNDFITRMRNRNGWWQ
jgi:hypothetical protein